MDEKMGEFAGTYATDLSVSDSVEPMLKAEGAGMMKRKIAASVAPTVTISFDGNVMKEVIDMGVKTLEHEFVCDGEEHEMNDEKTEGIYIATMTEDAIVVQIRGVNKGNNKDVDNRVSRYFEDAEKNTMILDMNINIGGTVLEIKRVLRRQ